MAGGRPSIYSEETTQELCQRIAEGETLKAICADSKMPSLSTFFKWLGERPEFSELYARAKEVQAEAMADEIIAIADTADKESANAVKVRVDARKWVAAKLLPKRYGDRQDINLNGDLTVRQMSDEQLNTRLADLLGKAGVSATAGGEEEAQS